MRILLLFLSITLAFSCKTESNNKPNVNTNPSPKTSATIPTFGFEIVNTYQHDAKAFTQGLVFHDGFLYESTGQYGESTLRKVDLETGKVVQKYDIPREYFAEGMTILKDKIYQISWREQTAWVYDLNFKLLKEIRYQGEGWGLTNDGTNLLMTDSTHVIRVVNPETFETLRTIPVFNNGQPLMNLNELEMVKGELWANIWHSENIGLPNRIVKIDPANGKILGWINLDGISPEDVGRDEENTLNGIAYDEKTDRIFVTGKKWKRLFEIKLKSNS